MLSMAKMKRPFYMADGAGFQQENYTLHGSRIFTPKYTKLAENICSITMMTPQTPHISHKLTCSAILFLCLTGRLRKRATGAKRKRPVPQRYGCLCLPGRMPRRGLDVLKKGGNAVDAAVAVQFALAVTHPQAGNIGGGGFMVYRSASGKTNTLDFREKAPAQASANMYLDSAGNVIPNMSLYTHFASGVPGSVDGMVAAHKKYGKLKWADLVQPAINLALNGFKMTARMASDINRAKAKFAALNPGKSYLMKDGRLEGRRHIGAGGPGPHAGTDTR
jgi:hypothetical protein